VDVTTPRLAQAVEHKVVPTAIAKGWTPSQLARAATKTLIALDSDGAVERAASRSDAADIRLYAGPDESATVVATGDAVSLVRVMDAIDAIAADLGRSGDVRPVGQRRLAALTELVLG